MPLFDLDISQEDIDLGLAGEWKDHPVIKAASRALQNTELANLKIQLEGEYFLTVADPPELQAITSPGVGDWLNQYAQIFESKRGRAFAPAEPPAPLTMVLDTDLERLQMVQEEW